MTRRNRSALPSRFRIRLAARVRDSFQKMNQETGKPGEESKSRCDHGVGKDQSITTRTVMKCGWAFAQVVACSFVSKKRSSTMALRSAVLFAQIRAALRLTTSG